MAGLEALMAGLPVVPQTVVPQTDQSQTVAGRVERAAGRAERAAERAERAAERAERASRASRVSRGHAVAGPAAAGPAAVGPAAVGPAAHAGPFIHKHIVTDK